MIRAVFIASDTEFAPKIFCAQRRLLVGGGTAPTPRGMRQAGQRPIAMSAVFFQPGFCHRANSFLVSGTIGKIPLARFSVW